MCQVSYKESNLNGAVPVHKDSMPDIDWTSMKTKSLVLDIDYTKYVLLSLKDLIIDI
jgi:hypothetical protein